MVNRLQTYLREIFGEAVRFGVVPSASIKKLPLYLQGDYGLGVINSQTLIFSYCKNENGHTITQLIKRAQIIETMLGYPVVYVFDKLESYNRNRLVRRNVAFILPLKQLYIPRLAVSFEEKKIPAETKEQLFPAAQCLLFFHLLGNDLTGRSFKEIAGILNYGQMTITRIAKAFESYGWCVKEGGREKTIRFTLLPKQLWYAVQDKIISPVEKCVHLPKLPGELLTARAGETALRFYTNLSGSDETWHAVFWKNFPLAAKSGKTMQFDYSDTDVQLQIWSYDPFLLSKNGYIDPLSLYASFKNTSDERVAGELQKLAEALW